MKVPGVRPARLKGQNSDLCLRLGEAAVCKIFVLDLFILTFIFLLEKNVCNVICHDWNYR